jgi:hypothetical protein
LKSLIETVTAGVAELSAFAHLAPLDPPALAALEADATLEAAAVDGAALVVVDGELLELPHALAVKARIASKDRLRCRIRDWSSVGALIGGSGAVQASGDSTPIVTDRFWPVSFRR